VNTEGFALSILLHACLMANIDSTSSHNVSDHGTYLFISETSCDDARAGTVFGEADGGSAAAAPVSDVCPSDGPNANTTGAQRDHPVADSSVADAPVADELPTGNPRFCPMCGTCDHDLSKTAGRRAILLAAALDASTKDQFERAFDSDKPFNIPFKVCRSCNNKVDAAIKKVEEETPPFFPDVCPAAGGTTGKRGKNAVKLGMALVDESNRPLIKLFACCADGTGPALQRENINDWVPPLPSSTTPLLPSLPKAASPPLVTGLFRVNDNVSVPPRMQPGVNKPGGVGVVTAVYSKTVGGLSTVLYLVKYVMGGAEQDISESLLSRFTPVSDQQRRRSVGAATTAA